MRILITGVAGFIGSNLARALLEDGHTVVGIDNFSFGTERNITLLRDSERFSFYEGDVRNPDVLSRIEAETVVHLASHKIPRYTSAYETLTSNSQMTQVILARSLETSMHLVFASTSDIYGKNPQLPYTEQSDSLLGPTTVKRWAYATSKIYSEQMIQAWHQDFGLRYTIMRFFGSYGPNQNLTWWGGPQSVFIQSLLEGGDIEIHGDGLQTRTFTYVEDTVQGIVACVTSPKAQNEIFNIAGEPEWEITILDLAHLIADLMEVKNPPIKLIPYASFGNYEDVRRRVPCIEKIKSKLGFKPRYSLEDGLARTILWQRQLFGQTLTEDHAVRQTRS